MKKILLLTLVLLIVSNGCNQPSKKARHYFYVGIMKTGRDNIGAIDAYTKVIELEPFNIPAYFNRAGVRLKLSDYEGAINDYSQCIQLEPSSRHYEARGLAKYYSGNYSSAIVDYNKAIELAGIEKQLGVFEQLYLYRGEAKRMLGDYKGAFSDLNKVCDPWPGEYLSMWIGNKDFSTVVQAFIVRGKTKNQINDKKGAISDFSYAIQLDPNSSEAYYLRGLTKIALGQKNAGCLDLRKAGDLGYEKAFKAIAKSCQ